MKRITVLGSTGSIGRQTIEVIEAFPEAFSVAGLAAGRNVGLLAEQIDHLRPEVVWVAEPEGAQNLAAVVSEGGRWQGAILHGQGSLPEFYEKASADLVVSAVSGQAGLYPTFLAAQAGHTIALANKESLVMAGELLKRTVSDKGGEIIPIDSEHSAIMQCLIGERREQVRRLILTASGGPFRTDPPEQLRLRTFAETQKHPVWPMGEKINVDSSTLMNKGLEVIEACLLFDQPPEKVEVIIHPQCIVHSMVEFIDGSIKAQMSTPDMRLPILYALSTPRRLYNRGGLMSLDGLRSLSFEPVDMRRFKCLELAYSAARAGGSMPAVMCVADEVAIGYFKRGRIGFTEIPEVIERTMDQHDVVEIDDMEILQTVNRWACGAAETAAERISHRANEE